MTTRFPHVLRKIRFPAVAGSFYSNNKSDLVNQIESCFKSKIGPGAIPEVNKDGKRKIIGIVSPHAGYMYSGPVAAHGFSALAIDGKPETFVIIGPNHTGYGSGISIMINGIWRTPLGDVEIDYEVSKLITEKSNIIDIDDEAHIYEHSVEVQIPFLQYIYGNGFKIVPIVMMLQGLKESIEIGKVLGEICKNKNIVIIASSDFTHYESYQTAYRKDEEAIKTILELNQEAFYNTINTLNISVCGPGPIMTLITAVKAIGPSRAILLKYANSGDVTGDYSSVVGYASIAMYKH
ncbi:MAG: MEMO1 family protein [Candidatus Methanomethylicia archaeon]